MRWNLPFTGALELDTTLDDVDWGVSSLTGPVCCPYLRCWPSLTWRVQSSTDETSNGTGDEVVADFLLLGLCAHQRYTQLDWPWCANHDGKTHGCLGQVPPDEVNGTEVTSIPPHVSPESRLHALVQSVDR